MGQVAEDMWSPERYADLLSMTAWELADGDDADYEAVVLTGELAGQVVFRRKAHEEHVACSITVAPYVLRACRVVMVCMTIVAALIEEIQRTLDAAGTDA